MAFNPDQQSFEQYVRQSVEIIHRTPPDEVWEKLSGRLDADAKIPLAPLAFKQPRALYPLIWSGVGVLTAAAVWIFLILGATDPVKDILPSPLSYVAPLSQHVKSEIKSDTVISQPPIKKIVSAANHTNTHQAPASATRLQKEINDFPFATLSSLNPIPANRSYQLIKSIPLPNPWSKTLSFNYSTQIPRPCLGDPFEGTLVDSVPEKQQKSSFKLPKLSWNPFRRGNEWDYQVGLVAANFFQPEYDKIVNHPFSKTKRNEVGGQVDLALSERFRLTGGLRMGFHRTEFDPELIGEVLPGDFHTQVGIDREEMKDIEQFISLSLTPEIHFQGKLIWNPKAKKSRFFSGLGTRWTITELHKQKLIARLQDNSIMEAQTSRFHIPTPRFGLIRICSGIEWPVSLALNGQIAGFAQLWMPLLTGEQPPAPKPIIGLEGSVYVCGNRGYFRRR